MAIQYSQITAVEFNNLWTGIKDIILNRLGEDSLGSFCLETTSFQEAEAQQNNIIFNNYYKSISDPLRAINPLFSNDRGPGQEITSSDWNKMSDNIALINSSTGCSGSCAGLCAVACSQGCKSGCGTTCTATCGSGCTGNCANSCGGCRGCSASCGSNCTGSCSGCSSGCTSSCGGCGSGCTSICKTTCSGQCYGCTGTNVTVA